MARPHDVQCNMLLSWNTAVCSAYRRFLDDCNPRRLLVGVFHAVALQTLGMARSAKFGYTNCRVEAMRPLRVFPAHGVSSTTRCMHAWNGEQSRVPAAKQSGEDSRGEVKYGNPRVGVAKPGRGGGRRRRLTGARADAKDSTGAGTTATDGSLRWRGWREARLSAVYKGTACEAAAGCKLLPNRAPMLPELLCHHAATTSAQTSQQQLSQLSQQQQQANP
eukprot:358829-Chlamydomonas_euryale.AAC.1